MKSYELTIVMPGKTTAAKKKDQLERVEKIVEASGGKVVKTDEWGVKDLAYPIKKEEAGLFIGFEIELTAASVKSVADKIKTEENIIRHILIAKD